MAIWLKRGAAADARRRLNNSLHAIGELPVELIPA